MTKWRETGDDRYELKHDSLKTHIFLSLLLECVLRVPNNIGFDDIFSTELQLLSHHGKYKKQGLMSMAFHWAISTRNKALCQWLSIRLLL